MLVAQSQLFLHLFIAQRLRAANLDADFVEPIPLVGQKDLLDLLEGLVVERFEFCLDLREFRRPLGLRDIPQSRIFFPEFLA